MALSAPTAFHARHSPAPSDLPSFWGNRARSPLTPRSLLPGPDPTLCLPPNFPIQGPHLVEPHGACPLATGVLSSASVLMKFLPSRASSAVSRIPVRVCALLSPPTSWLLWAVRMNEGAGICPRPFSALLATCPKQSC